MNAPLPAPRAVPFPPVEPPTLAVHFPDVRRLGHDELAAVSRTIHPSMVLQAYRRGIFPWPVNPRVVPWVCPRERAILPLDAEPEWSRSLRKTLRRGDFRVTFDRAFGEVLTACATARDGGTWITPQIVRAYCELHALGWAHSVECWNADGAMVGGLYGLAIDGTFAGESMFHRETDASKVAFVHLVRRLRERGFALLDAQVRTDHLVSLGCVVVPREEFLARLEAAAERSPRFCD